MGKIDFSNSISQIKLKTDIQKLVNKFKNEIAWQSTEEHIQTYFTTELLNMIGWDSAHVQINKGQDVKTGKRPDILLHNQGSTIFVIESKDASKKEMLDGHYQDKTFVEQLKGYANAEGICWGILTNFVEWRVYSIYQNRLYKERKYAFKELLWPGCKENDYIDLLSDEGLTFLEQLSIERLCELKGRWDSDTVYYLQQEEIKEIFFQDLKKWRISLRNYLQNKYSQTLDIESIDLITQKMLDRLIFTDYCSDNRIITQDRLHAILHSKGNIYNELKKIFSDLDEKFNSELFSMSKFDEILIDDEIIRPIIKELANTDFRQLSVNVIGEVYENYLGELLKAGKSTIKVNTSGALEKKKSQGIYYTPSYVVDFIIENTVGVVLNKCKTVNEIESVKVIDPACGSGSFLIRVFDEFLKHYKRIKDSPLFEFEVRKRILQKNIYGIDLDERAIEITKLNLLVKALENSSHLDLSGRKILPNLKLNIRCGNSLVGGERMLDDKYIFYEQYKKDIIELNVLRKSFHEEREDKKQADIFGKMEIIEHSINSNINEGLKNHFHNVEKIKPINYSVIFSDVISNGGFDCVVGNPPYIDSELMTKEQPDTREFISKYFSCAQGNWDIYISFLELASRIVKNNGYWAYITPDKWISKPFGDITRKKTIGNITDLVKVGRNVFSDAKVDSIITVYSKKETKRLKVSCLENGLLKLLNQIEKKNIKPPYELDYLFSNRLSILDEIDRSIEKGSTTFECENACATSDAYKLKPYIIDLGTSKEYSIEKHYKMVNTGTIGRFCSRWGQKEMTYLGEKYLKPIVKKNIFSNNFKNSYGKKASKPKLIFKSLTLLDGCIDTMGEFIPGKSTLVIYADDVLTLKCLCAIFNSQLSFFYISHKYSSSSYNQGINFTKNMLNSFPVPLLTNTQKNSLALYFNKLNSFYSDLYSEKIENAKHNIEVKIYAAEREMNALVYLLYKIRDENKEIIKGSNE